MNLRKSFLTLIAIGLVSVGFTQTSSNQLLQKGLDAILSSDTLEDTFSKFFGVMAEGIQFDCAVLLRLEPAHFTLLARQNSPDWPEQADIGSDTLLAVLSGRHSVAVFNLLVLPVWGEHISHWWPAIHSVLLQ